MAKSICPNCSQITLSFTDEVRVECPICGTIFKIEDDDPKSAEASLT